jgi:hypothetical protein
MKLLCLCCGNKKNTVLEMRSLSKNEYERIISDLLEDNNITEYKFTWKTDKLPCDIRYLEGRIESDLLNNIYSGIHIIIYKNTITLHYHDHNTTVQSQIFFNALV